MKNNTLAVSAVSNVFEAATRFNAAGNACGRRMSFIQEAPAGDIRKALKAQGLKGKQLTAEVDKVLRGDSTMGWACFEASISAARSKGFVPVLADLNKAGNKITAKLERPSVVIDKVAVGQAIEREYSLEELEAIVAARKAKLAEAAATEVTGEVTEVVTETVPA